MADRLTQLQDTVNQVHVHCKAVMYITYFYTSLFDSSSASGTLLQQHRRPAAVLSAQQVSLLRPDWLTDSAADANWGLCTAILHADLALRQRYWHPHRIVAERGQLTGVADTEPEASRARESGGRWALGGGELSLIYFWSELMSVFFYRSSGLEKVYWRKSSLLSATLHKPNWTCSILRIRNNLFILDDHTFPIHIIYTSIANQKLYSIVNLFVI